MSSIASGASFGGSWTCNHAISVSELDMYVHAFDSTRDTSGRLYVVHFGSITGLVSQFISIPNNEFSFPCKVILLESYALFHPFLKSIGNKPPKHSPFFEMESSLKV